ncbi:GH19014 [Drosophila grimshawi]|uniref:GH19014 n=1 Tax=Drosophila grimshawi TaxID=7222 RepID=B4JHY9_DROGR|nr:GH19014 [Drosophila grimshawi]
MQNLSISCSLVCLIILGSAALVGAFGVCQRQISAILITGVMYLLAALFALFTLMIIHFKRQQGRPMLDSDYDGTVDGIVARPGGVAIVAKPLLGARVFLTSWSLDLGWGGVLNALPLGGYGSYDGYDGYDGYYGSYGSTNSSNSSGAASASYLLGGATTTSTRQAEHRGKGKYIL